ncbi:enoyl-CoA hydratase [Desulfonema ishimotonii]|nr:enoyl-CoA hydratase [Desulfonema ishimotonii]
MQPVLYEKSGRIGTLTLNQPETRNALSLDVIHNMQQKFSDIAQDRDIAVLVIKGNGPAFCAGHNLKEFTDPSCDIHHFRRLFGDCSDMMQALHRLPQPVIAQVHGIATAAGCQLVAACDLAIAESGARFSTPGVHIGLFCSTPMVPLSRVIGRRRALEMLLSGRFVSADEAREFGLVNKVVGPDELDDATERWAAELAQYSPFTLGFGKRAFYSQIDTDEPAAYAYAQEAIAVNCLAEDAQEGIRAFLEKRKPQWKGR